MQQNGFLYHSADNGFACAAAGKGVKEALQEHLNVIVRDDKLETDAILSEIKEEMKATVQDKEKLEDQKLDREKQLDAFMQNLAESEARLSTLQIQIKEPLDIDIEDDSHAQDLQAKIDGNTLKIEENASELEPLLEERTKIETDLEAPTQVELEPLPPEEQSTLQSTRLEKGFACFMALAVIGLTFYLFIFYASVGDRTFTGGIGTNAEKQDIIIPRALFEAWRIEDPEFDPRNYFVITFPFIFLTLAFLAYYCHEHKDWWILGGILIATFLIDTIIAVKISKQMHEFKTGNDPPYVWSEHLIEILSVLLLGFGVSLLLSYGLYWFMKIWKGAKPNQDAEVRLARLIRSEKNDRLIELNALLTRIQRIQEKNRKLNDENQAHKRQIELSFKKPIETEIAELQSLRIHRQKQIQDLGNQIQSIQREINICEGEIDALVEKSRKKFVDIKKLEKQANEFIAGWCRYISQSKTLEEPEKIAQQISGVQNIAQTILQNHVRELQKTQGDL